MGNEYKAEILIFISMPFKKDFKDTYEAIKLAITSVSKKLGLKLKAIRVDEIKSAGNIINDIVNLIRRSFIVIADITGNNPNVLWEVGYALALKKPVILISQSLDNIPFNLRTQRIIIYDVNDLVSLSRSLSESVKETILKYQNNIRNISIIKNVKKFLIDFDYVISITGSMMVNSIYVKKKISNFIPLLLKNDKRILWLTGSYGVTDEVVAEYLAQMGQNVIVVGYNMFDISGRMLSIVNKYNLNFIDPYTDILLPELPDIPKRDLLFYTFSDLIILVWNGKSLGTEKMINWCVNHKKDHVILFI